MYFPNTFFQTFSTLSLKSTQNYTQYLNFTFANTEGCNPTAYKEDQSVTSALCMLICYTVT